MQANHDSTMKPAAAALSFRWLADGPRPKPVGTELYGASSAAVGVRFMVLS
jgi:hypothetical protein